MSSVKVASNVKSASVGAIVTLGPESAAKYGLPVGTQIDLGTVAYYHKNPLIRFIRRHTTHRRKNPWLSGTDR